MASFQFNTVLITSVLFAVVDPKGFAEGKVLLDFLGRLRVIKNSSFYDDEVAFLPLPGQTAAEVVLETAT